MSIRTLRRAGAVLLSTTLLAGASPAALAGPSGTADEPSAGVVGGGASDRTGDVQTYDNVPVSQSDLDRIDLTETSWKVTIGRRASFKLHVVGLGGGKHRAAYGVAARAGADSLYLGVRGAKVIVLKDVDVTPCDGSRVRRDRKRDVIAFSVPVRCLDTSDTYRFQPYALLESRTGADLATDTTRRTDPITIR